MAVHGRWYPSVVALLALLTLCSARNRYIPRASTRFHMSPNASSTCGLLRVVPVGWFAGRNMGPAPINTLQEIESLGKYVAPVL
jgi:hypothetical protein